MSHLRRKKNPFSLKSQNQKQNAEYSAAIIMNKVPEKLEDPGKFLIPFRFDGFTFLADFVMVNFEPNPRVPIILGRPFLRTVKALIDLYEETLTLR
ncbi:reverse transcriptase domain-containing protein, partial [Tanacetum coccineum]